MVCIAAILNTVPLARSLQRVVADTVGREFFTYTVFIVVCVSLVAVIYFLFFKYQVKSTSQYAWLFFCAGVYIYFTLQLKKHPEEAIHFVEYGLLSYFVFRALSARIHDKTIYITALFLVAFVGTLDEFIQWMMPGRYWDYRDVGINALASVIFMFAVWRAVRPGMISGPAKKHSLKMLALALTISLTFFGLCLSNTPDTVKRYTAAFPGLSWLLDEELMTEFGYRHRDEAGAFISRMTIEEIKSIDLEKGKDNAKAIKFKPGADGKPAKLINDHSPYTDSFMYEFLIHAARRYEKIDDASKTDDQNIKPGLYREAYLEHRILEKYFSNTLRHSGLGWPDEKIKDLQEKALSREEEYISYTGIIITFIDLKTVWMLILGILVIAWIPVMVREETG